MSMRIVFMGTPDFAVPSLKILLENNYEIIGVVTAPDKPSGRGLKMNISAVKEFALQHRLKILQPVKLKEPEFVSEFQALNADLAVVVAFRMLPEIIWNAPRLGSINLHASLLPKYRGAAPINWAIVNGENETGATTFFLEKEIDTGKIIFSEKTTIGAHETAGELHDRLMHMGASLVLKTVNAIASDNYPQTPQNLNSEQPPAPKIFKETCRINWNESVDKIYNFIRGLSPYPTAWTIMDGKMLKIFSAEKEKNTLQVLPGKIETDSKTFLKIAASDGFLNIKELQLEGKKCLKTEDFLRGNKIENLSVQ